MTSTYQTTATQFEAITGQSIKKTVLLDNAVLMRLHFGRFGNTRKVASSQIEVNADKTLVKVSKKILDSPEYDEIQTMDGKMRGWVESQCLPSTFMAGLWFVPLTKVKAVNERMRQYQQERAQAVDALCAVLDRIICKDREQLRELFDASEYPTSQKIRQSYTLDWSWMALTAPKSLEAVSEEMYMSAKQKMEDNIREATTEIRMVLREQFIELVAHLSDRLEPSEDGKKKIFKDSMTENFQEFLNSFRDRNITEDAELARLVEDARKLVGGVSAKSLRSQEPLRDSIRAGMENIKAKLSDMVVPQPSRFIDVNNLPEM